MNTDDLYELMSITNNDIINKAFLIMNNRINNYSKIMCSISGGSGCPFGKNLEYELEVCSKYEPLLYKAICKVFKNSYEYTRKYNVFKKSFRGC